MDGAERQLLRGDTWGSLMAEQQLCKADPGCTNKQFLFLQRNKERFRSFTLNPASVQGWGPRDGHIMSHHRTAFAKAPCPLPDQPYSSPQAHPQAWVPQLSPTQLAANPARSSVQRNAGTCQVCELGKGFPNPLQPAPLNTPML